MVGSIKTFEYTDGNSNKWAVNMDESNGEAIGNTDFTDANYRSDTGPLQRRITVTDNTATSDSLPNSITVKDAEGLDVEVYLTSLVGEVVRVIPRAEDTAQDDGDET